jgi:hypothetical protein
MEKLNIYALPALRGVSTADIIIDMVCEHFNVTKKNLMGTSRKQIFVYPRHLANYLIRKTTRLRVTEIGKVFGRDHTFVVFATKKIKDKISINEDDIVDVLNYFKNELFHHLTISMPSTVESFIKSKGRKKVIYTSEKGAETYYKLPHWFKEVNGSLIEVPDGKLPDGVRLNVV